MIERRVNGIRSQTLLNFTGAAVTTALLGMLAFCLYALLYQELPKSNEIMLSMIIGMIVTKISTIVDFHYGGSESNKKLTDTISAQANTAQAAQATLSAVSGTTPGDVLLQPGDKVEVKAEEHNQGVQHG